MTEARKWGRAALISFAIVLIVISFLPLWWTDLWWVRLWDFPRLQVAALLVLVGAGLWFISVGHWRWLLLGGTAAALAWQASHFVAYLPPYPKQVETAENCPPGQQVSLLNANVLMTNRNSQALLSIDRQRMALGRWQASWRPG